MLTAYSDTTDLLHNQHAQPTVLRGGKGVFVFWLFLLRSKSVMRRVCARACVRGWGIFQLTNCERSQSAYLSCVTVLDGKYCKAVWKSFRIKFIGRTSALIFTKDIVIGNLSSIHNLPKSCREQVAAGRQFKFYGKPLGLSGPLLFSPMESFWQQGAGKAPSVTKCVCLRVFSSAPSWLP